MKLNTSNFFISHKSETCLSSTGNPLSVYSTISEAQESANYQYSQSGKELSPYKCQKCGKFHLKPTEFYCKKINGGCDCTDHNGKQKALYETRKDAEKMVNIRANSGVKLYVYQCPKGTGFHLTSSKEF